MTSEEHSSQDSQLVRMLERLQQSGQSLLVEKKGAVIFSSSADGLCPLVQCLNLHRAQMAGASVADKVVGVAAARLLRLAQVGAVSTLAASRPALELLRAANIPCYASSAVPRITNPQGTGPCPMETLALEISGDEELFLELKRRLVRGKGGAKAT
ncbi:MAG: DUF1893 domain-containing protein [Chloroflexota bacterium]